jgi:hypothetical protein
MFFTLYLSFRNSTNSTRGRCLPSTDTLNISCIAVSLIRSLPMRPSPTRTVSAFSHSDDAMMGLPFAPCPLPPCLQPTGFRTEENKTIADGLPSECLTRCVAAGAVADRHRGESLQLSASPESNHLLAATSSEAKDKHVL